MPGSRLFEQHLALLEQSAITHEVIDERGYVSAEKKTELERRGFSPSQRLVPALVIPLFDAWGQLAGYQARPDYPRVLDGKVVKYETPLGKRMVLDVPKRVRPMLGDPSVPLFITEGPRKADAAASVGLACVALLGVWNWRGTNEDGGKLALPDWDAIALNRRVFIVFDSDAATKRPVYEAMRRLKGYLEARGADVAVVYLPSGPAASKVGLDDYLAEGHGVDDLLAHASPDLLPLPSDVLEDVEEEDTFDDVPEENGAELLEDVRRFVCRFVSFGRGEYADTVALWAAHTHASDAADSTPRLAVLSPEKGSGKTRLLEVLELLVRRPLHLASISAAALFRSVALSSPTLLLDEVDSVFGPKASEHEELRALLNAGHRKGASVMRCVGDGGNMDVRQFEVYAPAALAGLGNLPDTILDRSVQLRMRRRGPGEDVEEFRRRRVVDEGHALARRLAAWAKRNSEVLSASDPAMPDGLRDRPADVWEPLLAIADRAGSDWPAKARRAAVAINAERAESDPSVGVRLLADIRAVFDAEDSDRLSTASLLEGLNALEESGWGGWNAGTGIKARDLAKHARAYGAHPKQHRFGETTAKGYLRSDFADAWERYLPPVTPLFLRNSETSGETETEIPPLTSDVSAVSDVSLLTEEGGVFPLHVRNTDAEEAPERLVFDL